MYENLDVVQLDELIEKHNFKKIIKNSFKFSFSRVGKGQARYLALFFLLVKKQKAVVIKSKEIANLLKISERQVHNINKKFSELGLIQKWKVSIKGKKGRVNKYETTKIYEVLFCGGLSEEENKLLDEFLESILSSLKIEATEENKRKTLEKIKKEIGLSEEEIVKSFRNLKDDFRLKLLMNKNLSNYLLSLKGENEYLSEIERRRRELLKKLSFG